MTLNDLKIKPRTKPTKPQTPSITLDTILNNPVVSIEKATTAVMVDPNFFMLVDAAGHAVWGLA